MADITNEEKILLLGQWIVDFISLVGSAQGFSKSDPAPNSISFLKSYLPNYFNDLLYSEISKLFKSNYTFGPIAIPQNAFRSDFQNETLKYKGALAGRNNEIVKGLETLRVEILILNKAGKIEISDRFLKQYDAIVDRIRYQVFGRPNIRPGRR